MARRARHGESRPASHDDQEAIDDPFGVWDDLQAGLNVFGRSILSAMNRVGQTSPQPSQPSQPSRRRTDHLQETRKKLSTSHDQSDMLAKSSQNESPKRSDVMTEDEAKAAQKGISGKSGNPQ